jgi:hypothetical protein
MQFKDGGEMMEDKKQKFSTFLACFLTACITASAVSVTNAWLSNREEFLGSVPLEDINYIDIRHHSGNQTIRTILTNLTVVEEYNFRDRQHSYLMIGELDSLFYCNSTSYFDGPAIINVFRLGEFEITEFELDGERVHFVTR